MDNKEKLHLLKQELKRVSQFVKAKYRFFKLKNFKNKKELINTINELKYSIRIYKRLLNLYKKELLVLNKSHYCQLINHLYKETKKGVLSLSIDNPVFSSIPHLKSLQGYFEKKQEYEKCKIIHLRINQLNS